MTTRQILHHSMIYFVTRFVGAGLQLVLLVFLTHTLAPDSYGSLSLFSTFFSFFLIFLFSPWRHALTRYWPEEFPKQRFFLTNLMTGYFGSALLWSALLVIAGLWGLIERSYLVALWLAVLAGAWTDLHLEYYRRTLIPFNYLKLFLLRSILQLVCVVLGVLTTKTAIGAVIGLAASHVLVALATSLQPIFKKTKISFKGAHKMIGGWLPYTIPLMLSEFIAVALSYTDRLMIAAQLDLTQTGLYAATHDLTWMGLHIVSLTIYLAFYPLSVRAKEKGDQDGCQQVLRQGFTLLFGLSFAATTGLIMLKEPVVQFVIGQSFQDGAPLLLMLIAMVHLVYILKIYWIDISFHLEKKTWPLLWIGIGTGLTNILLNMVFIPFYGTAGAALATGLSWCIALLVSLIIAYRSGLAHYPVHWPDILKIFGAVFVMASGLYVLLPITSLIGLISSILVGAGLFSLCLWVLGLSFIKSYADLKKR